MSQDAKNPEDRMAQRLARMADEAAEKAETMFKANRFTEAAQLLIVVSSALDASTRAAQYALVIHIGQNTPIR